MKVAIIGFGEAGEMFGRGLSKKSEVFAHDLNITSEMHTKAEAANVTLLGDQGQVLENADFIFSLVTADQAHEAAKATAPFLNDKQVYFEMNSVAPDTKRANAELIANVVDVAIMAPVYPTQMNVPLSIAHPQAQMHADTLFGLGMNAKVVGSDVGRAAAIKMCRSVMIKGMEALTLECILTARHYSVEDEVKASLHESFPHMGWDNDRVDYWFERVSKHGKRRAAEMREVARTVKDASIKSEMSNEIAKTHELYNNLVSERSDRF